jgi:aspartyl-tRNA synthetase
MEPKSSVDKFYDQADLSTWATKKNWSTGDMICVLSVLPIKQDQIKCFANGIGYKIRIRKPAEFAPYGC